MSGAGTRAPSDQEAKSDQATEDRDPLVPREGNVVIVSEAEFASWRETVHLLSSPRNAERLAASIRQARAGMTKERTLFGQTPISA